MEISVEDENGVGKCIGGITGFKDAIRFLLMAEVKLRDSVHNSSDLLRLSGQEEVAGEQAHELLEIVLFALAQHYLNVVRE